MDHRALLALAATMAAGRVAIGGTCTVAPRFVASQWIGGLGTMGEVTVLSRALGARDLLLGVGALGEVRRGRFPTTWLLAGAAADATDVVATCSQWSLLPRRRRLALATLASGAVVAQVALVAAARR